MRECYITLVDSWCFKVARRVWKATVADGQRDIFSGYVLYSWLLMGALVCLLSPECFRLTVSPHFNQHYTVCATSCSVRCVICAGQSAAQHLRRCTLTGRRSLDNLGLICFYIWFIHCSLSCQWKGARAGCTAVTDGCDLGVRLGGQRLFNGPIRSSYSALPHHDGDVLSLMNHLPSEKIKNPSSFLTHVIFTLTCTRGLNKQV